MCQVVRGETKVDQAFVRGAGQEVVTAAKGEVAQSFSDLDALSVTLPWLVAETRETMALMGEDFWPYGVARNVPTLEAQTRWSFEHGLSIRRFTPEDLFVESTLAWYHT